MAASVVGNIPSQPTRAAWIEICNLFPALNPPPLSQPTRAAWIEIAFDRSIYNTAVQSQPTRAAWIEIAYHAEPIA